ncbi:cysteine desulfurase family protein [Microcella alkalica]|uniref:Cysteine desulfurase n=1 Tax=Microcella alkalica TaxID=355930 RepID=A0A839E5Y2_9MICO|nr:cysteine desulfurase family protein [Microcella alkalica]MBA8846937.1 cysteine desulfurase [Microcella alkalica]
MTIIDLDQAATASVRRRVLEAMWPHLTADYGNPSSTHAFGRRAADALEEARARIARLLGVRAGQIVFTSGGTEADNLGVIGLTLAAIAAGRDRHVVVGAVEHEAVLAAAEHLARWHGVEVSRLGVDEFGRYSASELEALLRPGTALVAVQHANNEVGTIQPVDDLVRAARAAGARVHVDAVQMAGWMPVVPAATGRASTGTVVDARPDGVAISGHKLGAPKGVGALILPTGAAVEPLIHGGGQERERRSGTENVAGAVGLSVALELAEQERREVVAAVTVRRDRFIADVVASVPGAALTGHPTERLPAHASFVVPGVGGESLLIALDERGVIASSGSSCAAGRDDPSPVLLAMAWPAEVARTALRFSWGASTTQDELQAAVGMLARSAAALRV